MHHFFVLSIFCYLVLLLCGLLFKNAFLTGLIIVHDSPSSLSPTWLFESFVTQKCSQIFDVHIDLSYMDYLHLQVVPFTPSAGVLEWVDRTIPLGEYLLGRFAILLMLLYCE